jgi:diacylglycerol kinase
MKNIFHLPSRFRAFGFALNGIKLLWSEPHIRLHFIATLCALTLGILKHIDRLQWVVLFTVIALVWITEAINTAIERLCDFVCDGKVHPAIKTVKDISAGAVLIAATLSVIAAIFIFIS